MFTDEQLKQLRQIIREEVETEAEKTRTAGAFERIQLRKGLEDVGDRLKNLEIEAANTRKELTEKIETTAHTLRDEIQTAQKEILARIDREAEDAAANFRATWEKMDEWHQETQELQERMEHVEKKLGIAHQN